VSNDIEDKLIETLCFDETNCDEFSNNKLIQKEHFIEFIDLTDDINEEDKLDLSVIIENEIISNEIQPAEFIEESCELLKENEWLLSSHIAFYCLDLKNKFPYIEGLQNPYLFSGDNFLPRYSNSHNFIQIVHVNKNHWVCISNYECGLNELSIYDSRSTFNQTNIKDIQSILKRMKPLCQNLVINIKNVQRQSINSGNCGLFSIAYAQLLCNNKDPTQYKFDEKKFRTHFNQCIINKIITDFPHILIPKENVNKSILYLNLF
jgi:hypothetical protein